MTISKKLDYHICTIFLIILIFSLFFNGYRTAIDVSQYAEIETLNGHSGSVNQVIWSPDGSMLASASSDNTIKIWDIKTNVNLLTISGHNDSITSISWSPDSEKIASASYDHTIKIWDAKTGVNINTIDLHRNQAWMVAWNPNGTILASAEASYNVRFLNPETGIAIKTLFGHTDDVNQIVWSPDGSLLASTSLDQTVIIWNTTTGKIVYNFSHEGTPISWSPNGKNLAFMSPYSIDLMNTISGNQFMNISDSLDEYSTLPSYQISLSWSPDSSKIATISSNNKIKIWDTATAALLKTLSSNHGKLHTVAWSPNEKNLASGSDDGTVVIWGISVPNVCISAIMPDKNSVIIGDNVTITVTLSNNGTADGRNVIVDLYDGLEFNMTNQANVPRGGINSTIFHWRTSNNTFLGAHDLGFVIGACHEHIIIKVEDKPNVYVQDIQVDKTSVITGKSVIIIATIMNNGTADAKNVDVFFYEDKVLLTTMKENITSGGTSIATYKWNTKRTNTGDHVLKVVIGNSSKQTTVHINKHPTIILNYSNSAWLIGLIILLIAIISLILGYDNYKKRFK